MLWLYFTGKNTALCGKELFHANFGHTSRVDAVRALEVTGNGKLHNREAASLAATKEWRLCTD